jgi:hypothetical protein
MRRLLPSIEVLGVGVADAQRNEGAAAVVRARRRVARPDARVDGLATLLGVLPQLGLQQQEVVV